MSARPGLRRRAVHLFAGFAAALAVVPLASRADDLVFMQGASATVSSSQQAIDNARDKICTPEGFEAFATGMTTADARLRPLLGALGADPGVLDTLGNLGADGYMRFCNAGTPVDIRGFRIIYAECRMTMHDGQAAFDLRIPPGQGTAILNLIDYAGRQVVTQPVDISGVLGRQVDSGTSSSGNLNGPNGTRRYVTDDLDVDVSEYTFNSSFRMDLSAMAQAFAGSQQPTPAELNMLNQIMGQPIITSNGTAWVTRDVDGYDTVRTYYENFAAVIDSGQGATALMSGLFNHYVLRAGMPLEIETTTDIQMASLAAGLPGALGANVLKMPGGTTTHTAIDSVLVTPMPNGYCEANAIPDGFAVVDPTAGLNPGTQPTSSTAPGGGAGPGVPAAGGGPGQPAGSATAPGAFANGAGAGAAGALPAGAADEIAAALGQLTPEQQQALSGLGAGFGQLLGGLAGNEAAVAAGANGAGAAGGAANAQQDAALQDVGAGLAGILNAFDQGQGNVQVQRSGTPNAGTAAPAAARPSSASLMTGDLTESVQNMLRALGYDPGAANGQLSTETIIAISQFQAEKGLEVTGEVTPQLVGILAAEVDR